MAENGNARAWGRSDQPSPYAAWQKSEGIPIYTGSYVTDLKTLELAPWARVGQKGAFVNLADQEEDDGRVIEIAPGGQTSVQHHLFEATTFIVEGRGATSFWQEDGQEKQTVEWQRGSLFAPPLNCYYQHFNLDGQQPARLFSVTNAPNVINLFSDPEFVFNVAYPFKNRYDTRADYFTDPGKSIGKRDWQTNFVPDTRGFKLIEWLERGAGGTTINFRLGNNTMMAAHISEFPPGTYKKAHRHGVGAHVIILGGEGYSLLWFKGDKERTKVDWKDGAVLSPKAGEYHQHFNTGPTPARYLALRFGVPGVPSGRSDRNSEWNTEDELNGIDYELQDPAIHELYVEECKKHGAEVRLPQPAYASR
jgi:quercetin dioxygenase-like cupin family protein